jgi:PAS domain S-box-containing protein
MSAPPSDIERLLHEEAEARREAERVRNELLRIVERVAEGFVALDRESRYAYVNEKAAAIMGRSAAALIGRHVWAEFPEAVGQPFHAAYQKAVESQEPVFVEAYLPSWDRWFQNRIYPSKDGVSIFFTDITAEKEAAAVLAETRARLDVAMRASSIGFWDVDLTTNETRLSDEWKSQLGYASHEIADNLEEWASRLHPGDRESILGSFEGTRRSAQSEYQAEFRLRHRDGSYRSILSRAAVVRDSHGHAVRLLGCHVDITDLKAAQRAGERLHRQVQFEKRRLERVAACVPAGIVMAEAPSGRLVFSNRRAGELLGRPVRLGVAVADYGPGGPFSRDGQALASADYPLARALAGETVLDEELECVRPDGTTAMFLVSAAPVWGDGDVVEAAVASFHDVSELRQAREASRRLSQRLLSAQEEERQRVARDLHDDIGQVLTAVKISLGSLQARPEARALHEPIVHALTIVDGALESARRLSLRLRPPMLEHLGLGPTLRWHLGETLRASPMLSHLSMEFSEPNVPVEVASACFRVVQEALANALRHSRAAQIWVNLVEVGATLRLQVRDDGSGFDLATARANAVRGTSLGLVGMRERVALVGGRLHVRSRPGKGTMLVAHFPLRVVASAGQAPGASRA